MHLQKSELNNKIESKNHIAKSKATNLIHIEIKFFVVRSNSIDKCSHCYVGVGQLHMGSNKGHHH